MINLKELRKSKGIMKKYMQEQLGVTKPTYDRYESDPENTMTLSQANKVLEILGEEPVHIFLSNEDN